MLHTDLQGLLEIITIERGYLMMLLMRWVHMNHGI